QFLDRLDRHVPGGCGEVVASPNESKLASQSLEPSPLRSGFERPGSDGLTSDGHVFGCDVGRKCLGYLPLVHGGGESADPDRRGSAMLGNFVSYPFELLSVPRVEWKGNESVADLCDTQPPQTPPHGDPRGRGLAGNPVREENPQDAARTRRCNHGCSLPHPTRMAQ